jgi:hypothetical protein
MSESVTKKSKGEDFFFFFFFFSFFFFSFSLFSCCDFAVTLCRRVALVSDAFTGGEASIVNFVLFGLGRAGTIHANNLLRHPLAKIVYIVELDTAKAELFVQSHDKLRGHCKVLHPDQKNQALSDPVVHAAMCASTTSTHEGIIRACFEHKKVTTCLENHLLLIFPCFQPCFTEKPVAETVDRTMEG